MTRDGAIEVNETQQTAQRISQREQDADFQKTPEQQAAQDAAAQLDPTATDAAPLPRLPVTPAKEDAATAERVMEHIGGAQTRKASKKAVRKAQRESAAGARSSRLQFTDEERSTPELGKYIEKSDRAADRLDAARAAIPKEKKLVRERSFDEATGKGKTRLRFEEHDKPPGFKEKHSPLSRPAQEAGIFVHNKVHSVEKDNSGVEGAHKSEEAAEKGLKYGARKVREGYRSHKLKPYRAAAKAERAAEKANVNYLYQKALQDNPQIAASNPASRFMQKQHIKRQYAKAMKKGGAAAAAKTAENTRKAAKKTAEETKKTVSFVARHPVGVIIAVVALLLSVMIFSGLSSCSSIFSGTLNGVLGTSYTSEDSDLVAVENTYAGKEAALQSQIDNIESTYPGYDEYRYDLDDIFHNPHELASYLTALLQSYTPASAQAELQRVFDVNANVKMSIFAETKCNFSPVSTQVYTALIHHITCRLEAPQALIYQLVLGLTGENGKYNYSRAVHLYPPFFDISCSAKNYKIAPALTAPAGSGPRPCRRADRYNHLERKRGAARGRNHAPFPRKYPVRFSGRSAACKPRL